MDPIPTKCLEENTRVYLQGENRIPVKRANLTAPACVKGLEEFTKPLMSKAKKHRKVKGYPHYIINKVDDCSLDGH